METPKSLYQLDLNLLKVFAVLDEQRSVTKAAETLNLSQPAVSHALGRLREIFDDSLFVRTPSGMAPTPRAVQLSEPVNKALHDIGSSIFSLPRFNPATHERTFAIRTTDLIEQILLPELLTKLIHQMPLSQVSFRPVAFELPKTELESGSCDLAIAGFFRDVPQGFYQQALYKDDFLACIRRKHPRSGKAWNIDQYCEAQHLLIAPGGVLSGNVDDALRKLKRQRHISGGSSGFLPSIWAVLNSDCILTGPRRLIEQFEKHFAITTFVPPVKLAPIEIVQVWHERNNGDPAHQWLRQNVHKILRG